MLIHATRKLATRLPEVSADPLAEDSPLGCWHADRLIIDRRQCVLFCHDETRAVLFMPGLRKEQFTDLGGTAFRQLFTRMLSAIGCPVGHIRQAELALGPARFDTATERSVLSAMHIVRQFLYVYLDDVPNVLQIDPLQLSMKLTHRPTTVRGKWQWPDRQLRELVATIATRH